MWRRHDFYKKLLDLSDRIVLVDYKTDVFELIDNSIFVASVVMYVGKPSEERDL